MGVAINDVNNNSDATFAARVDAFSADLAQPHLQPTDGSPGEEAQILRGQLESGALNAFGKGVKVNAIA
jgi:hypothetical protein